MRPSTYTGRVVRRLTLLIQVLAACLVVINGLQAQDRSDAFAGSEACRDCHTRIYSTYFKTPMGRSSGRVGADAFPAGFQSTSFQHAPSGILYRIDRDSKGQHLSFESTRPATDQEAFRGSRSLEYYIGSGAAARGYIFSMEGYWFQSPVSYYSRRRKWDVAPGYEQDKSLDISRPVDRQCLECHASRVQLVEGTRNKYHGAPFLEGAVGCERCHGPGAAHVKRMSAGAETGSKEIVDPSRLEPARRDSVCARCHLTGEINVARLGRSPSAFRPGDVFERPQCCFRVVAPGRGRHQGHRSL